MKIKKLPVASQAFDYPLLIKSILAYSTKLEPNREIVYRDLVRYNYITLNQRVAQLANVLTSPEWMVLRPLQYWIMTHIGIWSAFLVFP
jgi:fatty-acyl-CoA synthase